MTALRGGTFLQAVSHALLQHRFDPVRPHPESSQGYSEVFCQLPSPVDLCAFFIFVVPEYQFAAFGVEALDAAIQALVIPLLVIAPRGLRDGLRDRPGLYVFEMDLLRHAVEVERGIADVSWGDGLDLAT
ncbi:MAG TPA: hypothetical protein VJH03_20525 [Blastocatellia bacterium]|nr:hypothetical protein [Blastocatellia bacterium]